MLFIPLHHSTIGTARTLLPLHHDHNHLTASTTTTSTALAPCKSIHPTYHQTNISAPHHPPHHQQSRSDQFKRFENFNFKFCSRWKRFYWWQRFGSPSLSPVSPSGPDILPFQQAMATFHLMKPFPILPLQQAIAMSHLSEPPPPPSPASKKNSWSSRQHTRAVRLRRCRIWWVLQIDRQNKEEDRRERGYEKRKR